MTNSQTLGTIEATNPVLAVAPLKEETEMLRATDKITALYCRLSVEDMKEDKKGGKEDVSNSIQNQKMILLQYAKENRFPNLTFFVDDGYSGTNYDRPGFQAMLAEIEAGRVAVCLTKDLSRLGRNSSLTGLYINFTFPKYNVRYIAINDHFDTIDPNSTDSDIAGIKNWFNEFFAKDTSRKIRAVQKAKGERGVPLTTNVPFGYLKDPADKTKWIVDEAAAVVVKRIFKLCMEGRGPMQIAKLLQEEKVLNPTAYKRRAGIKTPEAPKPMIPTIGTPTPLFTFWNGGSTQAVRSTSRPTPIPSGTRSSGKRPLTNRRFSTIPIRRSSSRKSLTRCRRSGSSVTAGRKRARAACSPAWFTVPTAEQKCGIALRITLRSGRITFVCANYRSNTGSCSAHFIRAVVLEDLVWMHMKAVIFYVTRYEKHFRAVMEHKLLLSSEEKICASVKRLEQAQRRMGELDRLFIRIYEDNVAGRINDERFSMMSRSYETEQEQLKAEIQTLQQDIEVQERQIENLEQFIQRVHKYKDLDELTPYALRELVKGVYIEAPDKSSGKRRQNIRISYDLVGFIPLNELMNEETA
jgi:Site-specific recombinases, DNA invertase Pin homologs